VFTDLLERVSELPEAILLLLTFALAYGESAFLLDLLVPGEVGLVFLAAALAEQGSSLPLAIALAAAGCALGDLTGYAIGRTVGLAAVRKWEPVRRHLEPQVEKAQAYFDKRGGVVIFLARFVGALRAVVPIVAGTARMPVWRFVAWSVPSAVLWSGVVMTLGYVLGRPAAEWLDRGGWIISGAVLTGLAVWWLVRRHRRRSADEVDEAPQEHLVE
jgi:membrane protein DedA with SNARE-associated domain